MINARTKAGIVKARADGIKFGRITGSKNKTTDEKMPFNFSGYKLSTQSTN
jgi:DNA invertase Pin-like site-specific DNA recombinase